MSFLSRQLTEGQSEDRKWRLVRKRIVTATDVSNEKVHNNFLKYKFNDKFDSKTTKALRHGTLTENLTKKIFNKIYDVEIKDCGLINHPEFNNNLAASPDGYFYFKDRFGKEIKTIEPCLIEIKNPFTRVINFLVPYKYWIQMQIQLYCTNLKICYYVETSIKFKEIFTEDDKSNYKYWGECEGDLKEDGKYWYLENIFIQKVERDDLWLKENVEFFTNMFEKLKNFHKPSRKRKKRSRKRSYNNMISDTKEPLHDYYLNENYMHNYVNNDTLSDFLNMYGKQKYNIEPELNPFLRQVANWNKECSGILRNNLLENYKLTYNIIQLPQKAVTHYDVPYDLHKMTLRYMKENKDIIINPYLIDKKNKMYINTFAFVKGRVLCQETNICNLNLDLYYPYIFKKKRLKTYSNKANKLTNHSDMRELKCSALYHIEMLNKFQSSKIDKAFVLGWGYEIKEIKLSLNPDTELFKNKVQYIIYKDEKDLIEKSKRALKWLTLCRSQGKNWDIYNLKNTVPNKYHRYLLPNTCNKNIWNNIKQELAEKYDDVGLIWGIGSEKRRELHNMNIYSWKDDNFKNYVNEKFKKRRKIMNNIIDINKNEKSPMIYLPNKKIQNKINNWHLQGRLDFFVDFETINTSVSKNEIIYLIGMAIKFPNGELDYLSYFVPELTIDHELEIVKRWMFDMKRLRSRYCRGKKKYDPSVFCWGNAEIQMLNSAIDRFQEIDPDLNLAPINFIDMCKMFKDEPILIKGAKEGFGLKIILANMVKNNLIEKVKYEDFCNRGDISITHALDYYKRKDNDIKNALIKYNEIDCIALRKIVEKIREFC